MMLCVRVCFLWLLLCGSPADCCYFPSLLVPHSSWFPDFPQRLRALSRPRPLPPHSLAPPAPSHARPAPRAWPRTARRLSCWWRWCTLGATSARRGLSARAAASALLWRTTSSGTRTPRSPSLCVWLPPWWVEGGVGGGQRVGAGERPMGQARLRAERAWQVVGRHAL